MAATGAGIRKLLFTIHLWVGVSLCILLIPLCLSGLVLMWPDAIDRLTNPPPQVSAGPMALPLAGYIDSARAALPDGARIQSLRAPQAPGEAVTVAAGVGPGRGGLTVWLDPASGKALKVGSPQSALWQISHNFHETLMVGQAGRPLVGVLGGVMLYLSLSGLWLWWPRGAFVKGFAWKRNPSTLMNLHYLGGFWVAIPLAIVALTGIGLAFPRQTEQLLSGGKAPGFGAPRGPEGGRGFEGGRGGRGAGGPGGPANLTADQAAAAAQALHPNAKLLNVVLPGQRLAGPPIPPPPGGGAHAWRVQLAEAGKTLDLWVADADGRAADASSAPLRAPPGASGMVRKIHEGDGGAIWTLIVTLTGVIPVALAVTGVWTWARLEIRKRRARAAA